MTVDRRPIRQRLEDWIATEERLLRWMTRRHRELDGRTPAAAVLAGDVEDVHAILDRWPVGAEQ
jgi:hypothetical protein